MYAINCCPCRGLTIVVHTILLVLFLLIAQFITYLFHCNIILCSQEIEKNYPKGDFYSGPEQRIEIESSEIKLSVPMDGAELNGWKVSPLAQPRVRLLHISV